MAAAVIVPVATVAIAYGLWWVSDRLLYIGPLDRAAFGWVVVTPVWLFVPLVTAHAWRLLTEKELRLAGALTGLAIAGAAAVLIWIPSAFPDCQFGAVHSPGEVILPAAIFGVVVGGGVVLGCRGALAVLRRAPWWAALLVGAGAQFALPFVSIIPLAALWIGPGCQRPL